MTKDEALQILDTIPTISEQVDALEMAIKALEQQPTEDMPCVSVEEMQKCKDIVKKYTPKQQPCDDAVSREKVLMIASSSTLSVDESVAMIKKLPCVNPQYTGNEFFNFDAPMVKKSMEQDAISREWLKTAIHNFYDGLKHTPTEEDIQAYIDAAPSVTQKSGKWIVHPEIETSTPEYLMFYECSECGDKQCFCKSDLHKKRYCPNCGAKMQESEDKE